MLEFEIVVSRWSLVVSQRLFLACPVRSEGTNNKRRGAATDRHCEENF
jgi:hypothetical protein